ncbi:MAG: surface antigen variable number repeat-containing protein [Bacteroidetes bacterium]|nr:surface antigen variable number repeat-containing protein [Bacteroidota bacterium]
MSFCISLTSKGRLFFIFFLFHLLACRSQSVDSTSFYSIKKITIQGNNKTKDRIILRELVKDLNDSIPLTDILYFKKRSEQNIFNTQLFIYDTLYPFIDHTNKTIEALIVVKERWYIWPVPVFEIQDRNFNSWWTTKDLFRINYGFALGMENFSGVKDRLVLLFQRGYSEKYGFSYRIPYINKAQTLGFNLLYVFGRNNEVTYKTQKNIPLYVRNYTAYLRSEHEAKIGFTFRPNLNEQTTLELVYKSTRVGDTVVKLNPDFFGENLQRLNYLSLQYRYTFDNRDNKVYPLKGWAFDAWLVKDGFNFNSPAPVDLLHFTASIRKHTRIFDRVYISNLVKGRWMKPDYVSFNFNRSLGYSDLIRGYEYYVMDGQRYTLTTNSLRYQIVKPRIIESRIMRRFKQFSTIPFYAFVNVFFDAGYVEDKFYAANNPLNNSWQYGYGAGLDLISYYDIVMRFEYSFNRQFQSGFFIHLTSGF